MHSTITEKKMMESEKKKHSKQKNACSRYQLRSCLFSIIWKICFISRQLSGGRLIVAVYCLFVSALCMYVCMYVQARHWIWKLFYWWMYKEYTDMKAIQML